MLPTSTGRAVHATLFRGARARERTVVMLGALVGADVLPTEPEHFEQELRDSMPSDKLDLNLEAFRRGILEVTAASEPA